MIKKKPERLLYSEHEAAKALDVCTKTLKKEVKAGKLCFVMVGRRRKYDPDDIKAYIESNRTWFAPRNIRPHYPKRLQELPTFEEARKKKPPWPRKSF